MRSSCVFFVELLIITALVYGAPVEDNKDVSTNVGVDRSNCTHEGSGDYYDQRQNGTENYRIHVKGVVVLVAPQETLLQAAQLGLPDSETVGSSEGSQGLKPMPRPPSPKDPKVPSDGGTASNPEHPSSEASGDANEFLYHLIHHHQFHHHVVSQPDVNHFIYSLPSSLLDLSHAALAPEVGEHFMSNPNYASSSIYKGLV